MEKSDKLKLSESDICDLFITPAIKEAGWDQLQQVRREVTLTPGPVVVVNADGKFPRSADRKFPSL